ncbi:MAG: cysteine methyltransferase [Frankiales bacterium]|nr:cysteine methyltransferase [Frankiales bacterium]
MRRGAADTAFDVREIVAEIPPGRVMSYGDIAEILGVGARQVGHVMSVIGGVPWHRVVRADGTPAACHGGEALRLLRADATPMRGERVDMPLARWAPPSD